MNFACLLIEIRRCAAALPGDGRRPQAIERIARETLADVRDRERTDQARRILAGFLSLGAGDEFDAALLDQMTPELVFRVDMIAGELLELGRTNEAARALRGAPMRPVH